MKRVMKDLNREVQEYHIIAGVVTYTANKQGDAWALAMALADGGQRPVTVREA